MTSRSSMQRKGRASGFTLVELMITIAILSIIAAIALPAYNGYITESKRAAARGNAEPLRLALESYWLDNRTYAPFDGKVWDPDGVKDLDADPINWHPSGDKGQFKYTVNVSGDSWGVLVESVTDDTAWARVEKSADGSMANCYADTAGAAKEDCGVGGSGS